MNVIDDGNNDNEDTNTIATIINETMTICPNELLEKRVLSVTLPLLKKLISQKLEKINMQINLMYDYKNIDVNKGNIIDFIDIKLKMMMTLISVKNFNNNENNKQTSDKNSSVNELGTILNECKTILNYAIKIIKHIMEIAKSNKSSNFISANLIMSLLKYIPIIILEICNWYSIIIRTFTLDQNMIKKQVCSELFFTPLQDLYQKTCLITRLYCNLIVKMVEYNVEKDLNMIKFIISYVGQISSLIVIYDNNSELNTKMIMWKTFEKFSCDDKDFIIMVNSNSNDKSNHDIRNMIMEFIKSLAVDIICFIDYISNKISFEKLENNEFMKQIKWVNILLEILDRLHQNYCPDINSHSNDDNNQNLTYNQFQFTHSMMQYIIFLTGYYHMVNSKVKKFELLRINNTPPKNERQPIFNKNWHQTLLKSHYCNHKNFREVLISEYNKVTGKNINKIELLLPRDIKSANVNNCIYAVGLHIFILNLNYHDIVCNDITTEKKIEMIIANMNNIQEEILMRRIKIPSDNIIGSINKQYKINMYTNIYEYTLIILCDIIFHRHNQLSQNFAQQELILLKYLLCEQFWPSLLCFDILKYSYRNPTNDFSITHLKLFVRAYLTQLKDRKINSYSVMLLSKLIIELFTILPENNVKDILNNCLNDDKIIHNAENTILLLLKFITKNMKNIEKRNKLIIILYNKLKSISSISYDNNINSLKIILTDLCERPSVKTWTDFMASLTVMSVINKIGLKDDNIDNADEITRELIKIWKFLIINNLKNEDINEKIENSYVYYCIIFQMMDNILDCTCNVGNYGKGNFADDLSLDWPLMSAILKEITEKTNLPSGTILQVCYYLKSNIKILKGLPIVNCKYQGCDGDHNNQDYGDKIDGKIIVNLICYLISITYSPSSNFNFIHQEVLETFNFIIENSNDNNFIMEIGLAVKKNPRISKIVTAYLRNEKSQKFINYSSTASYLQMFANYYGNLIFQRNFCNCSSVVLCNDYECKDKIKRLRLNENTELERNAENLSNKLMELIKEKDNLCPATIEKLTNLCRLFIKNECNVKN